MKCKEAPHLNNISHEFLIFTSPSQRSVDSSIAYGLGLFPEKMFKIYDFNNKEINREAAPPIGENELDKDYFNIIIKLQ